MLSIKVSSVTPLSDMRLLVIFENGVIKLFDVRPIITDYPEYAALENPDLFALVKVEPGGYGVSWTPELDASEGELWENGVEIKGLSYDDLVAFVRHNVIETSDVTQILDCSRQNIDKLTKRQRLEPIKILDKTKLFLRSDIERRAYQTASRGKE